ncbi:MAG: hypothetical protein ABI560_01910 [Myxococcales bacterium]
MRRPAVILFTLALGAGLILSTASEAKTGKSANKNSKAAGKGAAPSAAELAKLKAVKLGDPKAGLFSWGMSSSEVLDKAGGAITARFKEPIDKAQVDPGKQQRLTSARDKEIAEVKRSYTKFEGQKTGWDVSIIGPEFAQNDGEAVIQLKEENWTRYFFFFEDRLVKMFLAFNKEMIGDKSFRDFGKEMAAKYGTPREVYRDEKQRGSVKRVLDHFEWAPSGGDALKLVDRSEFYGVYCLVISEAASTERIAEKRKMTNPDSAQKDSLVEAVVNSKENGADSNDDIIDRVTGHEVKKPGSETKHGDIIVPMPTAPTPADVNAGAEKPNKKTPAGKKEKVAKDPPSEKKSAGSGLEL